MTDNNQYDEVGRRHGYWEYLNKVNKQILSKGWYYHGILIGEWYFFDENGKTGRKVLIENGLAVKTELFVLNPQGILEFSVKKDDLNNITNIFNDRMEFLSVVMDNGKIIQYEDCFGEWYDEKFLTGECPFVVDDKLITKILKMTKVEDSEKIMKRWIKSW